MGANYAGEVKNCFVRGAVKGGINSWSVGGIAGASDVGAMRNCNVVAEVVGGTYSFHVGGLVGENSGLIINCSSDGFVSSELGAFLGGLAGSNYKMTGSDINGIIINCYSTVDIRGKNNIGGLVGNNYAGSINNCYAIGEIIGLDNSNDLGGLVGHNFGPVSNCYSAGSVFCGNNSEKVGGFVGWNTDSGLILNCFWDIQSSGLQVGFGYNEGNIKNLLGKITEQMKKKSTFAEWDFVNIWGIEDNQTYPFLTLKYLIGDINLDGKVDFIDLAFFAEHWLEGM